MNSKTSSNKLFADLLLNIIIPSVLLSQGPKWFGPDKGLWTLLLALAFPITHGLFEYLSSGKKNLLTLIGIVNVLMTGGLALMHLEGRWFAVKEAAFPFVIGIGVFFSAFRRKPFIETLIFQDHVFQVEKIQAHLQTPEKEKDFHLLLKNTTLLFSSSFLLSAILNFFLASSIFKPLDSTLTPEQKTQILNEQIAQMNWKSYFVIALPLLIMTFGILAYLIRHLQKITQLSLSELLVNAPDEKNHLPPSPPSSKDGA